MSALPRPPYAIVGLGLLGASLARALKAYDPSSRIIAVEPKGAVGRTAIDQGVVDEAYEAPGPYLETCGLAVICVPFAATAGVLQTMAPHVTDSLLLTDVAGVKNRVQELVEKYLPQARFVVGGHPMAGGELGGYRRGRADLFHGARVALCPLPGQEEDAQLLSNLWQAVGAEPVLVTPDEHDRIVASTSHLPYLTAVAHVLQMDDLITKGISGRSLLNATRAAGFAPEIMAAVAANNPHIPSLARQLAEELTRLANLAENDPKELERLATNARNTLHRFDT